MDSYIKIPEKEVPIVKETDVIVIGGGVAGIAGVPVAVLRIEGVVHGDLIARLGCALQGDLPAIDRNALARGVSLVPRNPFRIDRCI